MRGHVRSFSVHLLACAAMLLAACGAPSAPAAAPTAKPQGATQAAPATNAPPAAAQPASASSGAQANAASSADDPAWQQVLDAAKKEGKLTIYGALLTGPEGAAIAQEFNKQTGLTVDFVTGAGSPMYQRIRQEAQGGASVADLFEGSQPWPSIVQKDGFFVSMKDKPLPAFKEPASTWYVPPPVAQENLEYVASRFPANRGHVVVNTNILKPEDYPKNYHDIATNPKFKGKVVWVNPRSTGDVAFKWIQWGYTAKGLSLEDVWRIYSQQSPIMLPAPMDGGGAIARGEGAISFSTSAIESLFKSGAPMKILLFPDVPYVDAIAGLGVVKDAPHPNAALVFVNWVLSKPGQEAITKIGGIRSIRKDVPDGTPSGLAPEVVGGGKRPPTYLMTGPEAMLAGDLHTAQVFMGLPEGVSQADFEKGVNDYVKEWEAKNGGPQDKAVLLEQ